MIDSIGVQVKRLREAKGWSQRMLGLRAHTSGSYISQLESSQLSKPGIEQLRKIAAALSVSLDDLLGSAEGAVIEQSSRNPGLEGIQRDLLAIVELDPEELFLIARMLKDRRAKLERSRRETTLG